MVLLALLALPPAYAQEAPLDRYVQDGLARNLALQQRQFHLEASRRQVDEAQGARWPSLSLDARYTRAGGGRTIDFPVGDLLNPAYGALSDLTGGQRTFPPVANQEVALLREKEQETRMRLTQPIYQPALRHAIRLRTHLAEAQAASVDAARRQLVADIKTAYFDVVQAEHLVAIFDASLELVRENLRVNERLVKHGKATHDAVFRAQAEVRAVEQQRADAAMQYALAVSAFNLLLDRPLDTPIDRVPLDALLATTERALGLFVEGTAAGTWQDLAPLALQRREELAQLDYAADAAAANLRIARTAFRPNVAFALDYGIQGTGYALDRDAAFRTASVVLQWNLFDGFRKRTRVERVRLEQQALETQHQDVARQIQLQVQHAVQRVQAARRSIQTAQARMKSARQSFRLVERKYEEGMASLVDFIDARTALTSAELNLVLTRYALLTRYAALERAAALYPLR